MVLLICQIRLLLLVCDERLSDELGLQSRNDDIGDNMDDNMDENDVVDECHSPIHSGNLNAPPLSQSGINNGVEVEDLMESGEPSVYSLFLFFLF